VSTDYLLTGKPNRAEEKVIAGLLQDRLENPPHRDSGLTPQELAVLLAAMLTGP
jgi:hypothetical protein